MRFGFRCVCSSAAVDVGGLSGFEPVCEGGESGRRTESDEELVVVRVVQALHQVGEGREFGKDLDDFGGGDELIVQIAKGSERDQTGKRRTYLLLEVGAAEGEDVGDDC